jgi:RNA polymerase sigma-70 factor, ECF subfamily
MFFDEKALIIELKQNNVQAFSEIFSYYHRRIYNFCLRLLPSTEDAEDAVQKVFIALWEQRNQIDENQSLTSYIYAIARYTAYHDFKRRTYHQAVFEQLENSTSGIQNSDKDEILYNELTNILNSIIDSLPLKRRMIFRLSRFYNLTYREIAHKLNISENTVDTQIRRALDYLRKEYNKYFR